MVNLMIGYLIGLVVGVFIGGVAFTKTKPNTGSKEGTKVFNECMVILKRMNNNLDKHKPQEPRD